jgi:hypothetical protein
MCERTHVSPSLVQPLHKRSDAVDAGKNQPRIAAELRDGLVKSVPTGRWNHLDGRRNNRFAPVGRQQSGEFSRLFTGAGKHDAFTKQRPLLEPVQLVPQPHDLSDHDDGRWFQSGFGRLGDDVSQSADDRALLCFRSPPYGCNWRLGRPSVFEQTRDDHGQGFHAHHEDQRPRRGCQLRPINDSRTLGGILMAGDHGHCGGQGTMRYRNARVGWDGDSGRHARHDFERHSSRRNGFGFFSASPEDEGISALQSHHDLPRLCTLDQQLIDFRLVLVPAAPPSSHINPLRVRGRMVQQHRICEVIVQDDIGLLKAFLALDRQQPWVSGTCTHQIHDATTCTCHGTFP